jgi:uncharacterized membrane protein YphA (DoxX/SURF4 family)
MVQGWQYLADHDTLTRLSFPAGLTVAGGLSLVVGFLTPIGAATIVLTALGSELAWSRAPIGDLLHASAAVTYLAVVAAAVGLLGPGWFSLDRLIFGRREIIIPRSPGPTKG